MIKKEIFNSRMNSLKNVLFSSYRRTATVLVIAVLTLAIPVTITLLGQQQDIRQRAAPTDIGCPRQEVSDGSTNSCETACIGGSILKSSGSQACKDYKQSIGDPNYNSYLCCNTPACPIGPISPSISCAGTTVTCTWSGGQNITSWAADIEQQGTITNISCSTRWYPPNGDGSGGNCVASASTRTIKYNNATPGTYHCTVGGSNTNYSCNSVTGSSGTCAIQGTFICNTDPTYGACTAPNNSCATNTGTRSWRYTTYNGIAGCTSQDSTQPCTASCTYPSTCQSGICVAPTATPTPSANPDLAIYNTSTNKQLYSAGESITTNIYIKNTQGSAWQGTVTGRLYYNTADGTNLISACLAGKQPPYGSCDPTKMSALFTDTAVSIPVNGYYQLKNVPLVTAIAAPGGAWMVYAYINPNATVIETDASSDTPANNGGNNMRGSSYGITQPTPTPPPNCTTGTSCSGACTAPANTCSTNNGTKGNCQYTTSSTGASCTPVATPQGTTQQCTINACTSPNLCTSGVCAPLPTVTLPTATATPTTSCSLKTRGDANCDGHINLTDLLIWRDQVLGTIRTGQDADFNSSGGKPNTVDLLIWRDSIVAKVAP